jgi:glycine cleavage system H protein
MSNIPNNLFYTKEHEWVEDLGGGKVRVGITDYAQAALGDIVYVQLPKIGSKVIADSVFAEVESTKSVSEIYAPVSGTVVAINEELSNAPEQVNQSPYQAGWIVEIELAAALNSGALLSNTQYEGITAGE